MLLRLPLHPFRPMLHLLDFPTLDQPLDRLCWFFNHTMIAVGPLSNGILPIHLLLLAVVVEIAPLVCIYKINPQWKLMPHESLLPLVYQATPLAIQQTSSTSFPAAAVAYNMLVKPKIDSKPGLPVTKG